MEVKQEPEAGNGGSISDIMTLRKVSETVPFELCIKADIILIEKLIVQTDGQGTRDTSEGGKRPNGTKGHP